MRTLIVGSIAALAAVLALPYTAFSQESGAAKESAASASSPHDLSGVWDFYNRGVPGQGIYATPSNDHPPLTAWAQARYDAAKPGYGPKAQPGGNDPILSAILPGFRASYSFPSPMRSFRRRTECSCSSSGSTLSARSGPTAERIPRTSNLPG